MTQLRLVHRLLGLVPGERHLLAHALRERVRAANAGVSSPPAPAADPVAVAASSSSPPLSAAEPQARLRAAQTRGVALVVALGGVTWTVPAESREAGNPAGSAASSPSGFGWVFVLRFFPARGGAGWSRDASDRVSVARWVEPVLHLVVRPVSGLRRRGSDEDQRGGLQARVGRYTATGKRITIAHIVRDVSKDFGFVQKRGKVWSLAGRIFAAPRKINPKRRVMR